ncbi:MAG: hypothetical protein WCC21_03565 [Candidatus Acidiferrales bacterium]
MTGVIFPQLARFTDVALLLLRLMVGIVFLTSGYKHLNDPKTRSKDPAIGLILLMLGAIQKKKFAWHSGFWGNSGTNGWSC